MANNYYHFSSKGFLSTLAASPKIFQEAIATNDWSSKRYIHDNLIFGESLESYKFPLDFIVTDGKNVNNVIEMRFVSAFLISENLKNLFEQTGLTGWKAYDVTIHKKNGEILPGFYGFSVTGRNPVKNSDEAVDIPDFFRLRPDWRTIIASQKVVDVLKVNKIKDFETNLICIGDSYYDNINFPK